MMLLIFLEEYNVFEVLINSVVVSVIYFYFFSEKLDVIVEVILVLFSIKNFLLKYLLFLDKLERKVIGMDLKGKMMRIGLELVLEIL